MDPLGNVVTGGLTPNKLNDLCNVTSQSSIMYTQTPYIGTHVARYIISDGKFACCRLIMLAHYIRSY